MLQILDSTDTIIHQGEDGEMREAFEYLTTPGWKLAETRGYKMDDLYRLNTKYNKKYSGELRLVPVSASTNPKITEISKGELDEAYLVGVHKHSFRSGRPARIIGVHVVTRKDGKPKPCYHIRWADQVEDLVAIEDSANYKIISFEDIIAGNIPKVK